jgi:4-hydroxy-tetrahydrodipicolinate synthase
VSASTSWPTGLLPALVTPLHDDELDVPALGQLIERHVGAGVSGLVIGGGTGEFGALSLDERRALAEESIRLVAGRVPVVVQTGALATRDTIALSRHAQQIGAFGLLVASPFGEPINWAERFRFYEHVTAGVDLPIMIYNTPPAGILTIEQVRQLAVLPNVSAIKDSSGDTTLLGDLLLPSSGGLDVFVGSDSFLPYAIAGGANGAVFGAASFIPDVVVQMIDRLRTAPNDERTQQLWRELRSFLRFMEQSPNYVALCKAGCGLEGLAVGDVRAPYLMPSEKEVGELAERLTALRTVFGAVTATD